MAPNRLSYASAGVVRSLFRNALLWIGFMIAVVGWAHFAIGVAADVWMPGAGLLPVAVGGFFAAAGLAMGAWAVVVGPNRAAAVIGVGTQLAVTAMGVAAVVRYGR